jgi:5-methylcytosine-specific restriction endonuclease McrA
MKMNVDEVKQQLKGLEVEVNSLSDSGFRIKLEQQSEIEKNMSFTGGIGRIYVKPYTRLKKYRIGLAGLSIEMYPFMRNLCKAECAGEGHPGKTHPEPYWDVDNFEQVREVVYHYARKSKTAKRVIETPAPQEMSEAPLNADRETLESWLAENERRAVALSENELIERASMADPFARKVELVGTTYIRNSYVADAAKKLADGVCDLCKQQAPFLLVNGEPYLESHHVVWLSRGGHDLLDNVVALCPNCHRKMHYLDEKADRDVLILRISERDA